MSNVEALSAGDITKVGVIVIVALIVIGALLSIVLTALVARLIIVVIVVVLGAFVWQQRSSIQDKINSHKCDLNATFFGIHLDAPQSVKDACG
ncbi:MAG: hypothetical protein QOG01_1123 [Pseudonocardiales bacterium]|jgi:hypothetical protein|nr:hypothetical protein [Pseudonocardiales bacterium]